jgi:tetratricopeptide (TPR) repeat protein
MNQLLLRDENDIDALLLRGTAYVKLFKNNKGLDDLDIVLDKEPDNIQALISRGAALARGGQGAWGLKDFQRAMEINPNIPVIYFNSGVVFFTYENWGAAMENFEKALELNPNYVEAITRIGMTKLNWSKYSKAEACSDFKKAQKMDDELAAEYVKEFCSK